MYSSKNNQIGKRQKIIDAAVSLFRRTHNVKRVSLETIAREAGVSPTTIYNNFGNREKLVFEVIKVLVRENIERNRTLVFSAIPFPQKLIGIMNGKMDMAAKLNSEVLKKIISQDDTIAPFVDRIYDNEIKPLWQKIVKEGKEQGYIDATLDDTILVTYVDILKAGLTSHQDLLRNFPENTVLIEQLSRIMFYGFLNKDIELFKKKDG